MTVITVSSEKGGTGKTSAATTIAAALALLDPTILIDLDSQGQCSLFLGLDSRSGVLDWAVGDIPLENCLLQTTVPGLKLLPGNSHTKLVDTFIRERIGGFDELVQSIRDLPASLVVIDTAPTGLLTEAALAAADIVIVPFEPETPGVDGVHGTMALLERLAGSAHVLIVPVAYDVRLAEHRQSTIEVRDEYGPGTMTEPIPSRSAVKHAVAAGQTIWEYNDPRLLPVRSAYSMVVDRVRRFAGASHALR